MTRTVKLRILNEVHIVLVGLHGDHLKYFYDKYAVFAENYFFNPKYKLGQWDGRIRYFTKDGKTYLYLVDQILPQLKKFGYTVTLEDVRKTDAYYPDPITDTKFEHIVHLGTGEPTILRDYQVTAVNAALQDGNGIILACTGAGKTLICAALCDSYGKLGLRTLTIVPNRDLINQTKAEYVNCLMDAGEYSGKIKNLDKQHVVSTWQALKNNPLLITTFDVVIVDECHGLKGNILNKILTEHAVSISHRFGVTGTLPKDPSDLMAVHIAVGMVKYQIEAKVLQSRKVLSTIQINVLQLEEDLTKEYKEFCESELVDIKPPSYSVFKDNYFGDYSAEKSHTQRKEVRINWIADLIQTKRDSNKGNVLCLVDNISFGRKIAELVPNAIFVNGQDVKSPEKRKEIYDMFEVNNDLVVLATVHIAGTGLSINRIFNLITVDVGKSFIRVIQGIGRGLRKSHDKDHVTFTDICSDLKYGKKHLANRINYYKDAEYPCKKFKIQYENNNLKDLK